MILFHPSSLGLLMTDAQSVDRALVPAELLEVCDKARKTDADRAALLPYKEASLSAGAKTYLNTLAKQEVYGYRKVLDVKYLDKGNALEAAAIQMLNDLEFKSYTKNTQRLENEFLTGEPDIWVPAVRTIDTKVSWSLDTFPSVSEDAHDPMYEWQGRGYMQLCDVPEHRVSFLMLDTPSEMCRWEQPELHRVSHIPPELRHTSITYMRCPVLESKMNAKCATARAYLLRRIELIHAERIPKKTIFIGVTMPDQKNQQAAFEAKLKAQAEEDQRRKEALEAAALMDAAHTEALLMNAVWVAPTMAELCAELAACPGITAVWFDECVDAVPVPTDAPTAPPTLRLGQIGERFGFVVTADFLTKLGFAPAATDKAAKLYHESDFKGICAALRRHIADVQQRNTVA